MPYNRYKHHRRSIRLKQYDYKQAGIYFITICVYQKKCLFGKIVNRKTELNEFGKIAAQCWYAIPQHFPRIVIDEFVIMPNHMHGILIMTDGGLASNQFGGLASNQFGGLASNQFGGLASNQFGGLALPNPYRGIYGKPVAGSIPTIIGSFKSAVTKQINILRNTKGSPVWQRNYYEHIVRNENSLNQIRQYIIDNPRRWQSDRFNPNNSSTQ